MNETLEVVVEIAVADIPKLLTLVRRLSLPGRGGVTRKPSGTAAGRPPTTNGIGRIAKVAVPAASKTKRRPGRPPRGIAPLKDEVAAYLMKNGPTSAPDLAKALKATSSSIYGAAKELGAKRDDAGLFALAK